MEKLLGTIFLLTSVPLFFVFYPGTSIIEGVTYIALILFAIYFICVD